MKTIDRIELKNVRREKGEYEGDRGVLSAEIYVNGE